MTAIRDMPNAVTKIYNKSNGINVAKSSMALTEQSTIKDPRSSFKIYYCKIH